MVVLLGHHVDPHLVAVLVVLRLKVRGYSHLVLLSLLFILCLVNTALLPAVRRRVQIGQTRLRLQWLLLIVEKYRIAYRPMVLPRRTPSFQRRQIAQQAAPTRIGLLRCHCLDYGRRRRTVYVRHIVMLITALSAPCVRVVTVHEAFLFEEVAASGLPGLV